MRVSQHLIDDLNTFDDLCEKSLFMNYNGEFETTELSLFKTLV